MSKYHDDRTRASNPVNIGLSLEKLRKLDPKAYGREVVAHDLIHEHLGFGDSRAAVVASLDPLLVAAYTDEIDCIVLLKFPTFLIEDYGLEVGSRLLTINTYLEGRHYASDLRPGSRNGKRYTNYYPVIADFVSGHMRVIAERKAAISEQEWDRAAAMAEDYLANTERVRFRRGHPYWSEIPEGQSSPQDLVILVGQEPGQYDLPMGIVAVPAGACMLGSIVGGVRLAQKTWGKRATMGGVFGGVVVGMVSALLVVRLLNALSAKWHTRKGVPPPTEIHFP